MIKRLYVNNFRCLENFELPISERPSTLMFGKNGSGKSTIGAVLEIFQSIDNGTNQVDQIVRSSDVTQSRVDTPIYFEIEVAIDGKVYEYVLAFALQDSF